MKKMTYYCLAIAALGYLVACSGSKKADTDKNQVEVNVDVNTKMSDDSNESNISYQEDELDTFEVATRGSSTAYGGTFTKTNNKCKHSLCQCSGYWGYKHQNGTFEGNCSNSDGFGHTCRHSPQDHGLKKY